MSHAARALPLFYARLHCARNHPSGTVGLLPKKYYLLLLPASGQLPHHGGRGLLQLLIAHLPHVARHGAILFDSTADAQPSSAQASAGATGGPTLWQPGLPRTGYLLHEADVKEASCKVLALRQSEARARQQRADDIVAVAILDENPCTGKP